MKRFLETTNRPFAIALGVFVVLNLPLALLRPRASGTGIWLRFPVSEPVLSIIASVAGLGLLLPHAWSRQAALRYVVGSITAVVGAAVAMNVVGYYTELFEGRIRTTFPVPLSLFILVILSGEISRLWWWSSSKSSSKSKRRSWVWAKRIAGAPFIGAAFLVLVLCHIMTFGLTDYRRPADAAVVLGAKVYRDGSLSGALTERMETGVELYRQKWVGTLILSGGYDPVSRRSEAEAMRAWAVAAGVPDRAIIVDPAGSSTANSARGCREIVRARGFKQVLAVSHYYHNARVKLIFEREGVRCLTVPAGVHSPLLGEAGSILRECLALPFYFVRYL